MPPAIISVGCSSRRRCNSGTPARDCDACTRARSRPRDGDPAAAHADDPRGIRARDRRARTQDGRQHAIPGARVPGRRIRDRAGARLARPGHDLHLLEPKGGAGLRQPTRSSRFTARYVRIPHVLRRSARRHAAARWRRRRHRARGVPLRHRGNRLARRAAPATRTCRASTSSVQPGRRTACARAPALPARAIARASRATIRGAPTGCRSGRSERP